ncbi:MAG TPA: YpdA family putative bacillithiol disulfide reductase [Thermoanaerobaculia bacterium]|nr:YpdA family putative bacillithiol disulfide reductase [Thermoanaerobaculia bacterium]
MRPVAIVGAGPTGIACAVELGRRGVPAVCYERGGILHTIYRMPEELRWFSTRELLAIAGVPFAGPEAHPTRLETLAYYRGVADAFDVQIAAETEVLWIRPDDEGAGGVRLRIRRGGSDSEVSASAAIIATGFFDNPRRLGVPGEDLPHVHRRYVSGFPFHRRDVVVVGGKNSASEAALDLYRHGARVTMVVRASRISDRVKYWIKPDLENRIRAGAIRAFFESRVLAIEKDAVRIATPAGEETIPAEAVFSLVGYEPDFALFERCGIRTEGPNRAPVHDPETLESNVPGIYLAGALLGGSEIGRIFIENSRHHAAMIADAIEKRLSLAAPGSLRPALSGAEREKRRTFLPEIRTSPGNDPDR